MGKPFSIKRAAQKQICLLFKKQSAKAVKGDHLYRINIPIIAPVYRTARPAKPSAGQTSPLPFQVFLQPGECFFLDILIVIVRSSRRIKRCFISCACPIECFFDGCF